MSADPYVNIGDGSYVPKVGTKNKSTTLTSAYKTVMEENSARQGFVFQSDPANLVNILIRYNSTVYTITPGGSFSRNRKNGSVWVGTIDASSASSTAILAAEEN